MGGRTGRSAVSLYWAVFPALLRRVHGKCGWRAVDCGWQVLCPPRGCLLPPALGEARPSLCLLHQVDAGSRRTRILRLLQAPSVSQHCVSSCSDTYTCYVFISPSASREVRVQPSLPAARVPWGAPPSHRPTPPVYVSVFVTCLNAIPLQERAGMARGCSLRWHF